MSMKGREQSQGLAMESISGVNLIPSVIIHLATIKEAEVESQDSFRKIIEIAKISLKLQRHNCLFYKSTNRGGKSIT